MPVILEDIGKLPLLESGGIFGGSSRFGTQPQTDENSKERRKKLEKGHLCLTTIPA